MMPENIAIPINLDAFVLSPSCCDEGVPSKIAPITQPNYVGLRLDSSLIQHDVLEHIDFHRTSPGLVNPRIADLGANPPAYKLNRLGVNLHWSLPRLYRTAAANADSREKSDPNSDKDAANPVFRLVPNRWLVTRRLTKPTVPADKLPVIQSWVVESDALWSINEIPDDFDLETDVTPFVAYDGDPAARDSLKAQSEVFIGKKIPIPGWTENPNSKSVNLTIMNSSNPLFADYALQNCNVFSTIDNFAYKEGNTTQYLTQATADYFVIGWHSKGKDDPMANPVGDLENHIRGLLLRLPTDDNGDLDEKSLEFNKSRQGTRCLVHGAMYDVKYSKDGKPRSLADEAAIKFTDREKMEPVSIGTTALDGILTFLEAHKKNKDSSTIFGDKDTVDLADEILSLSQMLYATEDDYDSRVKAQDLIFQHNYAQADGGIEWHFAGEAKDGGPPATPSMEELPILMNLNEAQSKLDVANRKLKLARWNLFAEWWKYMSDQANADLIKQANYRTAVDEASVQVLSLQALCNELEVSIKRFQGQITCKMSNKAPFHIRKDPTMCIAGLDSGWPEDFMDPKGLEARLHHHFTVDENALRAVNAIFTDEQSPIPQDNDLRGDAKRILAECLSPSQKQNVPKITGFKYWNNCNPFIPMFIEWEALYYHIDKSKWDVNLRPSPVGHKHPQIRYGLNEDLITKPKENQKDVRSVSGRVLVMPQPVFSLEATVMQVLSNAAETPLTVDQIDHVQKNIKKLKFISAPLTGLTEHLLTRAQGAHVKPNVRVQGNRVEPLGAAVNLDVHLRDEVLRLIDAESALTPYGNLLDFGKDNYPGAPFKGVTHGQMLFTKLNIIDKFGQAICLPLPKPRPRKLEGPPPSIHPCLSDYLSPEVIGQRLNTVFQEPNFKEETWPLCPFIQLTPSINQDARLNAAFVKQTFVPDPTITDSTAKRFVGWHKTSDFEQPIWGWIVINYANYGLQFFLADGTFYREIRKGGVLGTNTGGKWLPFDAPEGEKLTGHVQMDELILKLANPDDPQATYLQSFFDMINGSIQTMPYPPSDYSGYANAIVGKPLALVNVGWSLEISTPALRAQNTLGERPKNEYDELRTYQFPLKLGDLERPFDGVVGYYITNNQSGKTNWDELFTYFAPNPTEKVIPISPENFPKLRPYYIHPESTQDLTSETASKFLITTMIIDPYTPLHAYSPILPIKSLKVPPWAIQEAFKRMTAFFRLGPCLLSRDVPAYDSSPAKALHPDTWATKAKQAPDATPAAAAVKLPVSGSKGTWNWLQPYVAPDGHAVFNSHDVGTEDTKIRNDPAPYTFVEGYLQLAAPLIQENLSGI